MKDTKDTKNTKNYQVISFSEYGEALYSELFFTPEEAIRAWFVQDNKNPMMVNLLARTKEDAVALIEWAAFNKEVICEMDNLSKCHIKQNYLLDFIDEKKEDGCKFFYGGRSGVDWDSVFPFCAG